MSDKEDISYTDIQDLLEPYGEAYKILIDMVGCDEIGCPPSGGDYAEHRNRILDLVREAYRRGLKKEEKSED